MWGSVTGGRVDKSAVEMKREAKIAKAIIPS